MCAREPAAVRSRSTRRDTSSSAPGRIRTRRRHARAPRRCVRASPRARISPRWPRRCPKTHPVPHAAATWDGSARTISVRTSVPSSLRWKTVRFRNLSAPRRAGTWCRSSLPARSRWMTSSAAPPSARASASARWKTNGSASCARCAARHTSTSGSVPAPTAAEAGRLRLALVPGEPAGVGPELCVIALQHDHDADITVFGDRAALERAALVLDLPLRLDGTGPGSARLVEVPHPVLPAYGSPDPANAASIIGALRAAADACGRHGLDGMVTGPVHKAAIDAGGIAFTGTTCMLAAWTGRDVVMMLANDVVRVALATVHLPLRQVADAITRPALERTIEVLHHALRFDFGICEPVIAVLGLNPHAGEDGLLGREEIEVIGPVLDRLRARGLRLQGPLPADTAFLP